MTILKRTLIIIIALLCLSSITCGVYAAEETSATYVVKYYNDAEMTDEITDLTSVDTEKPVYYSISPAEGYVCRSASVIADQADDKMILFGKSPVSEIIPECGLLGDVNDSGKVELTDVSMILKHLAGYTLAGQYNGRVADYNGDGKIALSDCTMMLKILANWNNVSPAYGVSKDFKMYCQANVDISVITQSGVCQNITGNTYLTVAKNSNELEAYITGVNGNYIKPDGNYTAEYLRNTYDDTFFSTHDLVIIDNEAPLFLSGIDGQVSVEINEDNIINIVIREAPGILGDRTSAAHCLISIPKYVGVTAESIDVTKRSVISPTFDKLFNYEESPLFGEIKAH